MQKYKSNANKRRALTRVPLTAAICLAFSAAAFAQDAPAPADPAQPDSAVTLDTVTVTAQKRTENLQKVPISMQVLGAEQLKELPSIALRYLVAPVEQVFSQERKYLDKSDTGIRLVEVRPLGCMHGYPRQRFVQKLLISAVIQSRNL